MDADIKAQWIDALRSGRFTQGYGRLRNYDNGFCCLGVLCEVAGKGAWMQSLSDWLYVDQRDDHEHGIAGTFIPATLAQRIGLPPHVQENLASLNDSGQDFEQIANHIAVHV